MPSLLDHSVWFVFWCFVLFSIEYQLLVLCFFLLFFFNCPMHDISVMLRGFFYILSTQVLFPLLRRVFFDNVWNKSMEYNTIMYISCPLEKYIYPEIPGRTKCPCLCTHPSPRPCPVPPLSVSCPCPCPITVSAPVPGLVRVLFSVHVPVRVPVYDPVLVPVTVPVPTAVRVHEPAPVLFQSLFLSMSMSMFMSMFMTMLCDN